MPRKTRKEKYAAKLHRLQNTLNNRQNTALTSQFLTKQQRQSSPYLTKETATEKVKVKNDSPQTYLFDASTTTEDKNRISFFYSDLRKSLIISLLMLLVESLLFLAQQNNLLKFSIF